MSSSAAAAPNYLEQFSAVASTMAAYLKIPILASSGIAAVLSSLLYWKQKALIYPSHLPADARTNVPRPSHFNIPSSHFEELILPTSDGESLSAFFIRAANTSHRKHVTVLMFHGNAGNIGHRIPIARMMTHSMDVNCLMLEYRGYGLSTGSPDEEGLMVDAQTALDYLSSRAETRDDQIVVYGQSLGGAVAVRLVAKNQSKGKIAGLILENTFLSMRKMIPNVIPPARYLAMFCHQLWPSEAVIPSITEIPVLFLSGLRDEIVPPTHMRRLYDLCQSPTKIWKALPEGDHNSSVLEAGYFDAIDDFIQGLVGEKAKL